MNETITLEIYLGDLPDNVGEDLTPDVYGRLDAETIAWLDGHGYNGDDPTLWVNVVTAAQEDEATVAQAAERQRLAIDRRVVTLQPDA